MNIDLSDLKVGNEVFNSICGIQKIKTLIENSSERFELENGIRYHLDGREYADDIYPSIFHSIEEFIEYFQLVKKGRDEAKPKKRYWLWSTKNKGFCSGDWIKQLKYYDDNGYTTTGHLSENWEKMEKIKHENEFIDV